MSAPTTLLMPRGMWGEPYRMGVNDAHNTVGENIGAYNTAWALPCQGGRRVLSCRCAGYGPCFLGIAVDLSALPYFLCPFPGPHQVGIPGQLVPIGSDFASRRRAISRGSVYPRSETRVEDVGQSRKRCLARPSSRRGRPEASWRPRRALRSERRAGVGSGCRSSSARSYSRRLDRPFGLLF